MTAPARPEVGEPRPWKFPLVQESRLESGLRLLTCHVTGKAVATVEVVADLPVDADPPGMEGLAVVVARCLDEGTTVRDSDAFAAALERHGATFHASAGYEGLSAAIDVPVSRLSSALPLLAEALREPAFPASEVERVVAQRIDQITQERANPAQRAAIEFTAALHPAGSRFGIPQAGTAETVERVRREAVVDAYRRVSPATTTVVVAGDLTGVEIAKEVAAAFDGWTGADQPWTPSVPTPIVGPRVLVVDRPDSVQTQLLLGHSGPDRRHESWPAMVLAAYVVGGTLTSRIDALLREEKGYTYGLRGAFQPSRRGGVFGVSGSVDSDSTEPALADLLGVLRTAVVGGVTEEEVAAARQYLVGVSPLRWETPGAVAGHLATVVGNDLPLSWTDNYLAALRDTTADDASAALAAHVHPDQLVVVAVGDPARVTKACTELGLPTPEVVTA
ncbi:MAG: hypothetical protein QOJ92_768 [Frankiales bacterium]|nr:hypothetical protein [Frankiales bacterium]